VRLTHVSDDGYFRTTFAAGSNHDRRTMRVVGTDEDATVATQLLESHPDVGLNVFDKMADMNMSVGVWQRSGHKNLSRHFRTVPFSSFKSQAFPARIGPDRATRVNRDTLGLTEDTGMWSLARNL